MIGVVGARELPAQPSEEEFRLALRSGLLLCLVINKVDPGAVPKVISLAFLHSRLHNHSMMISSSMILEADTKLDHFRWLKVHVIQLLCLMEQLYLYISVLKT